jgi:hypothetical protein
MRMYRRADRGRNLPRSAFQELSAWSADVDGDVFFASALLIFLPKLPAKDRLRPACPDKKISMLIIFVTAILVHIMLYIQKVVNLFTIRAIAVKLQNDE